eukprot:NODE_83_length_22457_cov_0.375794.p5 type:complete len:251 gc:universal NODE_83_length_22457_cov_0.375794:16415-17167(+)
MPNCKSEGFDRFAVELLKYCDEYVHDLILALINKMRKIAIYPQQFNVNIVCPISKGLNSVEIIQYRFIGLFTNFKKIIEKILKERYFYHVLQTSDAQYGMKKRMGRDDLATDLQIYLETVPKKEKNCKKMQKYDFAKAFDRTSHRATCEMLQLLIPNKYDRRLMINRVINQMVVVRIGPVYSTPRSLQTGLYQGSVLSALYFVKLLDMKTANRRTSTRFIGYFVDDLLEHDYIANEDQNIDKLIGLVAPL